MTIQQLEVAAWFTINTRTNQFRHAAESLVAVVPRISRSALDAGLLTSFPC
jgi:hypothetical protein